MMPILWAVLAFLWHWGWAASLVLGVYNLFHHAPAHARSGDYGGIGQAMLFVAFAAAMYYLPAFRKLVLKVLVWAYKAIAKGVEAIKVEANKP